MDRNIITQADIDRRPKPTYYILLHEDRHADPDVELWADPDEAVARADALVREYAFEPEDIDDEMNDSMARAGWLYHASYSPEGDRVTVYSVQLR